MNLHLSGHHLEVTPAIRDYITGKMNRITRHFDHVIDVTVVLGVNKLQRIVEANVHVRVKDIFAECHDLDAAIDMLVDRLDRQISKHKEKSLEHRGSTD
jgi:putative sigma-54 modulation protein